MREFFKGWSRKVGTALLVVATFFGGCWMRSFSFTDSLFFPVKSGRTDGETLYIDQNGHDATVGLWSCQGTLAMEYVLDSVVSDTMFDSWAWPTSSYRHELGIHVPTTSAIFRRQGKWLWQWFGWGVCESVDFPSHITVRIVSYWSIVLPVTLLSAVLLLWPQRKPKK